MCVIMTHDSTCRIDREEWNDAWQMNDDGGGIAWVTADDTLQVAKSLTCDDLWDQYRRALKSKPRQVIVHMRIATHGIVDLANCHPFIVRKGEVVAHNGILTQLVPECHKDESDSRAFARLVLAHLPRDWCDNPGIAELIEDYLGGDKLAVLTLHGKDRLYRFGKWERAKSGVWYSNRYHQYSWRTAYARPVGSRLGDDDWEWTADAYTTRTAPATEGPCDRGYCIHREHWGRMIPAPTAAIAVAAFPEGIDIERLATDDAYAETIVPAMVHAESQGYCPSCYWLPCQCSEVCHGCTRTDSDCTCPDENEEPDIGGNL